jgi:tRNA (mo5U34)-methyltransferase
MESFDTVFSMGVLYHRKSPIEHLMKISSLLKRGGELVLETLVVDGDEGYSLMPRDRYAKMRNVWFIPSVPTIKLWLDRCGFKEISLVDVTKTSINEQRATQWMTFESLQDFLDPMNENLTVEGYPAPKRAIVIGKRGK